MTQMDRVTQQNAALVEESASAATALEEQAITTADAVAVFRLWTITSSRRVTATTQFHPW